MTARQSLVTYDPQLRVSRTWAVGGTQRVMAKRRRWASTTGGSMSESRGCESRNWRPVFAGGTRESKMCRDANTSV